MKDSIIVNYTKIEKVSTLFDEMSKNTNDHLQKIQEAVVEERSGDLISAECVRHMDEQLLPLLTRLSEVFGTTSVALDEILAIFHRAEEEASHFIRRA